MPHEVMLADDYYMGIYEVTQRQYERINGDRPSYFQDDYMTRPVERVTHYGVRGTKYAFWPDGGHAVDENCFLGKLRAFVGQDGFDLPTEAQWEFACRAGCGAALYSGKELEIVSGVSENMGELGRYNANGGGKEGSTAKVGSYKPNAWGLYDMLGNVYEWCLDYYQDDLTGVDPATGPLSVEVGNRVIRGGCYRYNSTVSRCAWRSPQGNYVPYDGEAGLNGFRVAAPALVR